MPRTPQLTLAALAVILVIATGSAASAQHTSVAAKVILAAGGRATPFPLGFLGHPAAFAFAVFSMLTLFSFSLSVLISILQSMELKRDSCMRNGIKSWRSPINVYRVQWMLIMGIIVAGTAVNLMIYLAWGEVSSNTMSAILTVEKSVKGLISIPFCFAMYLFVEHDEEVTSHLSYAKVTENPMVPTGPRIQEHVKIVAMVFVMSILVTITKAYGLNP